MQTIAKSMPWRSACVWFLFVSLIGFTHSYDSYNSEGYPPPLSFDSWSGNNRNLKSSNSDIEFDKEPVEGGLGSGAGGLTYEDDEDFGESGSGSGSGMGDLDLQPTDVDEKTTRKTTTTTTTTTTRKPLSACEKMRQTSQQVVGRFVPRCLPNGDFDSLQCHGHPGTADCWCSDLEGREIPGTLMEAPNFPNCVEGYNLPPCVHQMVLHVRTKMLGTFRPRCAVDGQFDRIQCHGSLCYCVDEGTGITIAGTEVHIPDTPNCDDDSDVMVTAKPVVPVSAEKEDKIDIDEAEEPELVFPEEGTIDLDQGVDEEIEEGEKKDKETDGGKFEDTNRSETGVESNVNSSGQEGHYDGKVETASEIMTQPGILAGIIGGSVVLLLCLVLLVMFIVYRMRKKDEGSYPLDEPRRTPNYNYVRAPDKEFYA